MKRRRGKSWRRNARSGSGQGGREKSKRRKIRWTMKRRGGGERIRGESAR